MDIEWKDPGPSDRGRASTAWRAVADALRLAPGRWAMIRDAPNITTAANQAFSIRKGQLKAFRPAGSFESVSRGTEVYARFVGSDS
jgi:hypothetical protein